MATGNPSQQFNLRWNNHTSNILQVFMEQLNAENLVDVTLSCQGQFLKAHKMVLSACSPYFQELFRLHQVPHPVIIINGMKFLDLKMIVDFMYKGEIKVQEADLPGVLLGAETLQVKGLSNVRNKCEKELIKEEEVEKTEEQTDPKSPVPETSVKNKSPTDPFKARKRVQKLLSQEDIPAAIECSKEKEVVEEVKPSPQPSNGTDVEQVTPGRSLLKPKVQQIHEAEDDDDLPATIKVEPPDIRDIDEEEPYAGWESPRLVIDMDTKNVELIQPKQFQLKSQLRQIQYTSAHIELTDDDEKSPPSSSTENILTLPDGITTSDLKYPSSLRLKIPRPPNAFMIFANEWRRKLAYQNPMESNKEISVRLGVMWKNLNADTKEAYYSASRKADEDHKRRYPGYYYSPKEARIRKTLKLSRRPIPSTGLSSGVDALHLVKVFMPNEEKSEQTRPIILAKSIKKQRSILPKPDDAEEIMEIDDDELRLEMDDEAVEDEEGKVENGEALKSD